jgi:hypothetical protein
MYINEINLNNYEQNRDTIIPVSSILMRGQNNVLLFNKVTLKVQAFVMFYT